MVLEATGVVEVWERNTWSPHGSHRGSDGVRGARSVIRMTKAPRKRIRLFYDGSNMGSPRLLLVFTFATALVVGAVLLLLLGSWWFLAVAVTVHLVATAFVLVAIAAHTRETDKADPISEARLDEEADAAADFLEGLLDALDLPGDLRIKVTEDHADVELVDIGTGALIGRRGQTLEAIQELVRSALQREFQRRSRVKVDIEGYRARRLEKLLEKAQEAIDEVLDTGEAQRLEPMDVFERKAVHHLVAQHEGVGSRSQGREPGRRVVIEAT
jgi:spoIIIJ-associated protein